MSNSSTNDSILAAVKKIRTISTQWRSDITPEKEVNECLSHGWILLSVPSESYSSFVIGWKKNEEPPLTEWQKMIEGYQIEKL